MGSYSRTLITPHLRKYIVEQEYSRYTPEDQAVWRFMLRQLKDFLSLHAHPCYVEGLAKTGIEIDSIPSIDKMDEALAKFGWGAVPVSGFIPPSAFMEFQSLGILPIASDMRTLDHLLYTPAPDIVHEAAGHAPILVDPQFSSYLRKYAEVASHAIISSEDLEIYSAIRSLSDIKENPDSTTEEIAAANKRLKRAVESQSHISEAALLARMNWWTAEYGLIGGLERPKIFGAGLLSSPGESKWCLDKSVKKIPLTVDCIDYSYDITEPQPQLFVTPDFESLHKVLEDLSHKLAYKRGGVYGLEQAKLAQALCTVQLNSGVQISGVVKNFLLDEMKKPSYLQLSGPCQLSFQKQELAGHDKSYHASGFGSPIGRVRGVKKCLSEMSAGEFEKIGVCLQKKSELVYDSGLVVRGTPTNLFQVMGSLLLITWQDCTVTYHGQTLFEPSWGTYDMAVGSSVTSVYAGAADKSKYGEADDLTPFKVPQRNLSPERKKLFNLYQSIRALRDTVKSASAEQWQQLTTLYFKEFPQHWLPAVELVEISYQLQLSNTEREPLVNHLKQFASSANEQVASCIRDGLKLSDVIL